MPIVKLHQNGRRRMPETNQTATLIRGHQLIDNPWHVVEPDQQSLPEDEAPLLVPIAMWLQHQDALRARSQPVGVLIQPHEDPYALLQEGVFQGAGLSTIAINFPAYTDGRGFSIAQMLRNELHWEGELRAVGDVLIDTIFYLARCGFDSFLVKPGHDPEKALAAFKTFTVAYQRAYREVVTL